MSWVHANRFILDDVTVAGTMLENKNTDHVVLHNCIEDDLDVMTAILLMRQLPNLEAITVQDQHFVKYTYKLFPFSSDYAWKRLEHLNLFTVSFKTRDLILLGSGLVFNSEIIVAMVECSAPPLAFAKFSHFLAQAKCIGFFSQDFPPESFFCFARAIPQSSVLKSITIPEKDYALGLDRSLQTCWTHPWRKKKLFLAIKYLLASVLREPSVTRFIVKQDSGDAYISMLPYIDFTEKLFQKGQISHTL